MAIIFSASGTFPEVLAQVSEYDSLHGGQIGGEESLMMRSILENTKPSAGGGPYGRFSVEDFGDDGFGPIVSLDVSRSLQRF